MNGEEKKWRYSNGLRLATKEGRAVDIATNG